MGAKEMIDSMSGMTLQELAPIFNHLAHRVYQHRRGNKGYVPLEIFASCIGIGGVYSCVEIVVETEGENGKGYLLKRREKEEEQGWEGLYQIPGVAARITDNPAEIFARLASEIFGQKREMDLQYLGCEIHDEPKRLATSWTLIYLLKIGWPEIEKLSGSWKFFADADDPLIIGHHQKTLKWASQPNRPLLADLRQVFIR